MSSRAAATTPSAHDRKADRAHRSKTSAAPNRGHAPSTSASDGSPATLPTTMPAAAPPVPQPPIPAQVHAPVGGPASAGWREGTLTRAKELTTLCDWASAATDAEDSRFFVGSIQEHLEAAREAAEPRKRKDGRKWSRRRAGPLRERAKSNLDAAEAQLLDFAPPAYVLGQLPGLLTHVQCHLIPNDPRRIEFERVARRVGVLDADHQNPQGTGPEVSHDRVRKEHLKVVQEERGTIVTAVRAASSASLREQVRVRSFRDLLVATSGVLAVLAIALGVIGFVRPTWIPLCFAPEDGGRTTVVCPTAQSQSFPTTSEGEDAQPVAEQQEDIDDFVRRTVSPQDILIVELVGLAAAAVAAAGAIRGIRGSSERTSLPTALAVLKLPTGALTALLGILLMRGQFVPGLSALDSSAQILAWALVLGYAQQLFTHMVDRQGQNVLDSVRGAEKRKPEMTPP